jgi:hypothetical protein
MAMKEQQRQVYRSMQGKEVDMNKLINTNELTPAVGNLKVNARGDKLGPGGQIIQRREEILAATSIPDQINVRPTPVVPEVAVPVAVPPKKDVANMDPEGKE